MRGRMRLADARLQPSARPRQLVGEFDFRYNTRAGAARAAEALKGITGKHLTYRRTGEGEARA